VLYNPRTNREKWEDLEIDGKVTFGRGLEYPVLDLDGAEGRGAASL
jgi:hypothetical protein